MLPEPGTDAHEALPFDENTFQDLCQSDCGLSVLTERLKRNASSCREASVFLKRRAAIEEEYGRQLAKLARTSNETYSVSEGKTGSFVKSYQKFLTSHEYIGENRIRFSRQLAEMSEQLAELGKVADRHRKYGREHGGKLERTLLDCEGNTEKARLRFEAATEDLERILLSKAGESSSQTGYHHGSGQNISSSSSHQSLNQQSSSFNSSSSSSSKPLSFGKAMSKLKTNKNPAQLQRYEEEARQKMAGANDAYRREVSNTHSVRTDYFSTQLPGLLRNLKESLDEADYGTQYFLVRYAYLFEHTLVNDGLIVSPLNGEDGPGLKSIIDSIDIREDFKSFMDSYTITWNQSGQRAPRRDVSVEELVTSPKTSTHQSLHNNSELSTDTANTSVPANPTFGVDLSQQMARDDIEVPPILKKCTSAIEENGLDVVGIYRLSGTTSKIQLLKMEFDKDANAVDLTQNDYLSDINNISGVLKLWFRELPEPLIPFNQYNGFIDAAKIENDRLRHIRLHERINDLPDPNYATMMYLMGHLDKVQQKSSLNSMSRSNLALIFGPTLFRPPPGQESSLLRDTGWQTKAIETIITHQAAIFIQEEDQHNHHQNTNNSNNSNNTNSKQQQSPSQQEPQQPQPKPSKPAKQSSQSSQHSPTAINPSTHSSTSPTQNSQSNSFPAPPSQQPPPSSSSTSSQMQPSSPTHQIDPSSPPIKQ